MGEWRKTIPEGRDRGQSRVLVWVVGSLLALAALYLLVRVAAMATGWSAPRRYHTYPHELWYAILPWIVSLTFGVVVWALRAATALAALFGSVICLLVIAGTGSTIGSPIQSGLSPLFLLFLLTFGATKAGKRRKLALGVAEGRRGRNAAQILANLGAAGLAVIAGFLDWFDWIQPGGILGFSFFAIPVAVLAALCEATADTVSSEVGQAFGGTPILLTTLRRVPPGTDGAVSWLGTAAGVAASGVVALAGMWAMRLDWRGTAVAFGGGVAGLVFDSLLGATVERRGWLGNDLVNFSSDCVCGWGGDGDVRSLAVRGEKPTSHLRKCAEMGHPKIFGYDRQF